MTQPLAFDGTHGRPFWFGAVCHLNWIWTVMVSLR